MQVNPNSNAAEAPRAEPKSTSLPEVRIGRDEPLVGRDEARFTSVSALNNALDDLPQVRTEEIERAKKLVQSANYPPPYAIVRIARLLAMNWDGDGVDSAV
jgi:hypothetical protein